VEAKLVLRKLVDTRPERFGDERNPEVCRPNVVETRDAVDRKPAVWYPY
jgi:hypothetical protein